MSRIYIYLHISLQIYNQSTLFGSLIFDLEKYILNTNLIIHLNVRRQKDDGRHPNSDAL